MIVLDTNVFIYALGTDHPLRAPCQGVLAAIGDGRFAATTTLSVVQEFIHVRTRRRGRVDALRAGRDIVELFGALLPSTSADADVALELFAAHDRLDAFDAVLAATALNARPVTGLMSADGAFADVPGLGWVDPARWQAP